MSNSFKDGTADVLAQFACIHAEIDDVIFKLRALKEADGHDEELRETSLQ